MLVPIGVELPYGPKVFVPLLVDPINGGHYTAAVGGNGKARWRWQCEEFVEVKKDGHDLFLARSYRYARPALIKGTAVVGYPNITPSPLQMGFISGIHSTRRRLCDALKGPLTLRLRMTNAGGPRTSRIIGMVMQSDPRIVCAYDG